MTIKKDYNVNYLHGIDTVVEEGAIPDTLAARTIEVLKLHHANGDLGWVLDLIKDIEAGTL